ncbi:MAG: glycosyltransferase [Bryobacteraceae bacterium]|nr:glycosyltransferase [Bryobacteraceae bacterium]
MRAAIVHYWLLHMRGGEKVVEALCRLLPGADIFTLFYDPSRVSPLIRSRRVIPSFLDPCRKHYRSLLPLMPFALESFDLRGYDLVVSSESGPAKGVVVSSRTRHVCYCHTPMRYLWEMYAEYRNDWTGSKWKRAAIAAFSTPLRVWDVASAARVDEFVANSENVRRRIAKTYRRDAAVIHPPVAVESFRWAPSAGYYLVVSELVAYKRIDLAVAVCSRTRRELKIVGDGPEYGRLKELAGSSVEFLGHVGDDELRDLFSRCRAFLMPGEEDFGMTTVEALASGKAVIGLGRGGLLEIASEANPVSGFFFDAPAEAALEAALQRFEQNESRISPADLIARAARFSEVEFARKMGALLKPDVV